MPKYQQINVTSKYFYAITFLFIALSITTQTQAKNKDSYQIEMIVFETTAIKGWKEEFWPHKIPDITSRESYPITSTQQSDNTSSYSKNKVNLLNSPDQQILAGVADKLNLNGGYKILIHSSWIQNVSSKKEAQNLYFEKNELSEYSSSLKGIIKIYKKKYVHAKINVNLKHFIPSKIRKSFAKNESIDLSQLPKFWTFNLSQQKKINSGEIHYIDHPIFGVLLKIKRIPNKEP